MSECHISTVRSSRPVHFTSFASTAREERREVVPRSFHSRSMPSFVPPATGLYLTARHTPWHPTQPTLPRYSPAFFLFLFLSFRSLSISLVLHLLLLPILYTLSRFLSSLLPFFFYLIFCLLFLFRWSFNFLAFTRSFVFPASFVDLSISQTLRLQEVFFCSSSFF